MALSITNLKMSDIESVLNPLSAGSVSLSNISESSNINKFGLDPTYVSGSDADARLSTVNATPHKIGYFRNYDHDAGEIRVIGFVQDTTQDKLDGDVLLQEFNQFSGWNTIETITINGEIDDFDITFTSATPSTYRINASDIAILPYLGSNTWGSAVQTTSQFKIDNGSYTNGFITGSLTDPHLITFNFEREI